MDYNGKINGQLRKPLSKKISAEKIIPLHLRKRGLPRHADIAALADSPLDELLTNLRSNLPYVRTATAICLEPYVDEAADALLAQLMVETMLYPKTAICETLERGNLSTAAKLVEAINTIESKQYRQLPAKVIGRSLFPRPHDIAARMLAHIGMPVLPLLIEVLAGGNLPKMYEALDAFGFIAYYNAEAATEANAQVVIALLAQYPNDELLTWKIMLCLSAFPLIYTRSTLLSYADGDSIIGLEAQRSLRVRKAREQEMAWRRGRS